MSSMRTGADYRESLRDGRRVWILGEGLIDDVTTHPATQPMVDEYVAWYDRHFDPQWQDSVLMPADAGGVRRPAIVAPASIRMTATSQVTARPTRSAAWGRYSAVKRKHW